jgi:hypothetical protein
MPNVDPNQVASAGIQVLQGAIDKLNALKLQRGAGIPQLDAQIEALQDKQDDLRNLALRTIEDSDANRQAIAAMNTAAANLNAEAANIKDAAVALLTGAKIVAAAASLVTALAPFL